MRNDKCAGAGHNKNTSKREVEKIMCAFLKGMGAGLVVGACVGMSMTMDHRRSKRMLNKAVRNVNEMLENFTDSLGF